jgi:hypothetical protein
VRPRTVGLLVSGLAIVVIAAGAATFARSNRAAPPALRTAIIGDASFILRAGYLRPSSREGGALDQLDLVATYPSFAPAGDAADVTGVTDLSERYQTLVFITVRPSDGGLDPADRPARLYARFLEPETWSQPGGLIARAFQAGSPFEGDELYFVAPEGRQFAARCAQPSQTRKIPNTCVADIRDGGLDIELRFSAALLSEWENIVAGAKGLVEQARK